MGDAITAVIIFARAPHPGKVKTRLAAGIGNEHACSVYTACANHIFLQAARVDGVRLYCFYSEESDAEAVHMWLRDLAVEAELLPQVRSPDLGARMLAAFQHVFSVGAQQAVIVGTDIPDVTAALLRDAARLLTSADVAVGPAVDGGYYLLALRAAACRPRLFQDIEWSTATVRATTLARAAECRLVVAPDTALPTLRDLDTSADLRMWLEAQAQRHLAEDTQAPVFQAAKTALGLRSPSRSVAGSADGASP